MNTCTWCLRNGTHTADDHPLPPDHPDYDAVWDAPDDVLAEMVVCALKHFGYDHEEETR